MRLNRFEYILTYLWIRGGIEEAKERVLMNFERESYQFWNKFLPKEFKDQKDAIIKKYDAIDPIPEEILGWTMRNWNGEPHDYEISSRWLECRKELQALYKKQFCPTDMYESKSCFSGNLNQAANKDHNSITRKVRHIGRMKIDGIWQYYLMPDRRKEIMAHLKSIYPYSFHLMNRI